MLLNVDSISMPALLVIGYRLMLAVLFPIERVVVRFPGSE